MTQQPVPGGDLGAAIAKQYGVQRSQEWQHVRNAHLHSAQKMVSGLYQFISSPEELTIARQWLQALMQGDQVVAAAIGYPLYDTLLSIRNGVERSVENRQQTSAG